MHSSILTVDPVLPTTHLLEFATAKPTAVAMAFVRPNNFISEVSRSKLAQDVVDGSQRLHGLGIRQGDTVLLILENDYPSAWWFLAAIHAGAVPAILPNSEQAASPGNLTRLKEAVDGVGFSIVIVEVKWRQAIVGVLAASRCRILTPEELATAEAAPFSTASVRASDPIYLQFTTGTTAASKVARISHGALRAYVCSLTERIGLGTEDTTVGWAPFSHPMALTIMLWGPLFTGGTSVFIPPRMWLRQPALLMEAISRFRAVTVAMPNFGFRHCTERIREAEMKDLSLGSLKYAINSSELAQWPVMDAFCRRFSIYGMPTDAVRAAYGMSEYAGVISVCGCDRPMAVDQISARELLQERAVPVTRDSIDAYPVVSCGVLLKDALVKIVDDRDQQLGEREIGEIVLKGPALFSGYWGRTEIESGIGADGWFRTGDLGYFVGDELYVTGRKRDVIVIAGRKISAENLEAIADRVLGDRAHVVVAFGIVDPNLGTEVPVLVCERAAAPELSIWYDLEQLIRMTASGELSIMLADVRFVPRGWIVRRDNKISRAECRTKYLEERSSEKRQRPSAISDPLLRMTALFQEVLHRDSIQPADNFFELGGDSLGASRLVYLIEQEFGVAVPLAFYDIPTVAAAIELVHNFQSVETRSVATPVAKKRESEQSGEKESGNVIWRRRAEDQCFRLPYRYGVRLLGMWTRLAWVQKFFYQEEVDLFRLAHGDLRTPVPCTHALIATNLIGNITLEHRTRKERIRLYPPRSGKALGREIIRLPFWQDVAKLLDEPTGQELLSYVDVFGREYLTAALKRPSGTGLLLATYHHTGHFFSPAAIRGLIPGDLMLMGAGEARDLQLAANPASTQEDFVRERNRWFGALVHQAFQILNQGGTIGLAAQFRFDDHNCISFPIGGRIRPIKKGLAELGTSNGRFGAALVGLSPAQWTAST